MIKNFLTTGLLAITIALFTACGGDSGGNSGNGGDPTDPFTSPINSATLSFLGNDNDGVSDFTLTLKAGNVYTVYFEFKCDGSGPQGEYTLGTGTGTYNSRSKVTRNNIDYFIKTGTTLSIELLESNKYSITVGGTAGDENLTLVASYDGNITVTSETDYLPNTMVYNNNNYLLGQGRIDAIEHTDHTSFSFGLTNITEEGEDPKHGLRFSLDMPKGTTQFGGTYTMEESASNKFTNGIIINRISEGITHKDIVSGEIKIVQDSKYNLIITWNVTGVDDKVSKGHYSGKILQGVYNERGELTYDGETFDLYNCKSIYGGVQHGGHLYNITFYGYNLSETLWISLVADNQIETGTYIVGGGNFGVGKFDALFSATASDRYNLQTGTLKVAKTNDVYTFTFENARLDNGEAFTGSYVGTIDIQK